MSSSMQKKKRIHNGSMVQIENCVTRVTVRHHSAYPRDGIFNQHLTAIKDSYILASVSHPEMSVYYARNMFSRTMLMVKNGPWYNTLVCHCVSPAEICNKVLFSGPIFTVLFLWFFDPPWNENSDLLLLGFSFSKICCSLLEYIFICLKQKSEKITAKPLTAARKYYTWKIK